ncbi:hypothetical protein PMI23_05812, partial [Pseudomonas sp. GM24]
RKGETLIGETLISRYRSNGYTPNKKHTKVR